MITLTHEQLNAVLEALWAVDAHLDGRAANSVSRGTAQGKTRKAIKILDQLKKAASPVAVVYDNEPIEPSVPEQAEWPGATKQYVADLLTKLERTEGKRDELLAALANLVDRKLILDLDSDSDHRPGTALRWMVEVLKTLGRIP